MLLVGFGWNNTCFRHGKDYCSENVPWVPFGLSVLRKLGGGELDKQVFLMERSFVKGRGPSCFHSCICFKSMGNEHFGVDEPVIHSLGSNRCFRGQ